MGFNSGFKGLTYRIYLLKLRTSAMLVRLSVSREFAVFAVTLCQIFCVWLSVVCCLLRAKHRLGAAAVVLRGQDTE